MALSFKELKEFTVQQLARLKKEYEPLKGKSVSMANINKMNAMLDKYSPDMLMKLANADIPMLSTSAMSKLVLKHGKKYSDFKKPLDMAEADELQQEACWTGYKQVGFKKSSRTGKRVPNCVPESVVREMFGDLINEINDLRGSFTNAQLERMKQDWKNKPASALTPAVKQMIANMDSPTRAALEQAKINHISKFAGSTFEQKESVDPSCPRCEGEACECPQGEEPIQEGKFTRYSDLLIQLGRMKQARDKQGEMNTQKEIDKEMKRLGIQDEFVPEADLSKSQVKMVHKKADDMPKKDFIKRYGKDGDSVRYATATNMVKKQLGIEEEEFVPELKQKGDNMNEATYKDKFKAAMQDFGINSLDDLKSNADKKKFFNHIDNMHSAKNEELTPAQKKLPAGLQKAIAAKQDDKKEELDDTDKETIKPIIKQLKKSVTAHDKQAKQLQKDIKDETDLKEYGSMNAEMMKKEMMKKMEMMKAEADPEKMEMMKKEMMKEMDKMPEMMKKEMMKKMEMAMKEGFASDAQRKAAFASGYKEKGKKKKEEVSEAMKPQEMAVNAMAMNAMKMNAMKMPIRAMYKKEMKTGDDDMQPMSSMKMNAMTDPKKMNAMTMQDPKQDMAAGYMKSDVRAAVKDGGGADMAKVKDKPEMMTAMKKINAMYKKESTNKRYLQTKPGSLEEAVLISRGLVKEAVTKYDITMSDASFFKGNDLMKAMNQTKKDGNSDKALDDIQMYSADAETGISFTANNPGEAARMAEKAILNFRNKQVKNDRNALFAFDRLEIQLVNNKLPTSRDKQLLKRTLEKYSNEGMFNTPNGRGPSNLQKFVKDESLDDMVVDGVM